MSNTQKVHVPDKCLSDIAWKHTFKSRFKWSIHICIGYLCTQTFLNRKIFYVFLKKSLLLTKPAFIWSKVGYKQKHVENGWVECFRFQSSEEQHLSEIEIFCNIINVFIVTFDQFKASLLNKNINFYNFFPKKKKYIYIYTILPKVLGRPLLMNRFDYFSNFHEYKS